MTTPTMPVRTAQPAARFRDLLAAEWIKLRSLRSIAWALAVSALVVVGMNVNGAIADYRNWPNYSPETRAWGFSLALGDAFSRHAAMVLMLAAGSIGAVTVVSEYGTGLIRTTFAAVPARRSVTAAKLAVVTSVFLLFGALVTAMSFWLTQSILAGRHTAVPLTHPGVLRAELASALLAPLCALVGMGLGVLIRHSATTMVTSAGTLLLLPAFFDEKHRWSADIAHAMPFNAWNRLRDIGSWYPPGFHRASIGDSWTVYLVWSLASVAIALTLIDSRDL
jgi:hypothetical protein